MYLKDREPIVISMVISIGFHWLKIIIWDEPRYWLLSQFHICFMAVAYNLVDYYMHLEGDNQLHEDTNLSFSDGTWGPSQ